MICAPESTRPRQTGKPRLGVEKITRRSRDLGDPACALSRPAVSTLADRNPPPTLDLCAPDEPKRDARIERDDISALRCCCCLTRLLVSTGYGCGSFGSGDGTSGLLRNALENA